MFAIDEIEKFTPAEIPKLEADTINRDPYVYQSSSLKLALCKIKGIGAVKQLIAGFELIFNVLHEGSAYSHIALELLIKYPFSEVEKKELFHYCDSQSDKSLRTKTILGQCYLLGFGVKLDLELAFSWFESAAFEGYAPAELAVGFCYHEGKGVVENNIKAVEWYEKGAANCHPVVQNNLAYCYYEGIGGLRQNYQVSFELFEKAAEQNYAQALYNLGICYSLGHGTDINLDKGLELHQKALVQGYLASKSSIVWIKKQLSLRDSLVPGRTNSGLVQNTGNPVTGQQERLKTRLEKLHFESERQVDASFNSARMMPVEEVIRKPRSNLILRNYERVTGPYSSKAVSFTHSVLSRDAEIDKARKRTRRA